MAEKPDLKVAEDDWSPPELFPETSTPRQAVKKTRAPNQTREPQMAALRRILGDGVMGIFPLGIIQAVDKGYEFYLANPDSFLDTPFANEAEKDDALTVMRAYAECAPNGGYTIRTTKVDDPATLSWRTTKRQKNKKPEVPDVAGQASES